MSEQLFKIKIIEKKPLIFKNELLNLVNKINKLINYFLLDLQKHEYIYIYYFKIKNTISEFFNTF